MQPKVTLALAFLIITLLSSAQALDVALTSQTVVGNILSAYYIQQTYHTGQHVRIGGLEGEIIRIAPTSVLIETAEGRASMPAKEFSENVSLLLAPSED